MLYLCGVMRRLLLFTVALLAMMSCDRRAENFPPDNTHVSLDSTNLPIVWIEVGGDSIMRSGRIGGHMKIIHNGKYLLNYADTVAHPGQHVDYDGYIALRHRGNSTYNDSPKKAYSLRTLAEPMWRNVATKRKVSLLGMGKDNNWALLAPYSDKSMMRDLLAFEISRPWMEYTPQGRYCELFLDGTYYGVYVLCEVVSKGKQRLNLRGPGDKGDALTGDYLMEVDCDDDVAYVSKRHPLMADGSPLNDHYILFQHKSPGFEDLEKEQLKYIHGRIDAMERALATGDYSGIIDVMSFIDYELAMELGHNVDAYRLSGKFYKRRDSVDPRFKMVVWDMNQAYGNTNRLDGWRTDTWMYQANDLMYREGERYLIPFWWQRLNSDPKYTACLKERWAQYRTSNLDEAVLMATVDSLANVLTCCGAIDRNSQAWPRWGVWVWPNKYVAKDFADELSYLKQWLHDRIAWMDQQLDYQPVE